MKKTKPVAKVAKKAPKKEVVDRGLPLGRVARLVVGAHTFLSDTLTDIGAPHIPANVKAFIKVAISATDEANKALAKEMSKKA